MQEKLENCKSNTKWCFFFTVLSNDRYRKHWKAYPKFQEVRWRMVQPFFVGDTMELPKDPLGPKGPTLESFLRKIYIRIKI